ncbi:MULTISPECIES: hypothetical protein [Sphingobium]|uniref:Uncharacterized protein n=1 Tax=Sphingobium fuliginis ATCC 27551 TaxID=1208342 RepID=A0A5B8CM47_SPHSA|nr:MULTISPECIES: hypothetical protein [Sphingobium]KYC30533.1 hypothetical protein A0J57_20050 [Sphingobium sp. 22B]OAP30254.1 hypothetical protein A8O16_19355 [Sphingobium sp. 20006FA]QDC38701.1 hypothetical protein FIL70_17090 [Sphingobium fuliginis ATCC 27551]
MTPFLQSLIEGGPGYVVKVDGIEISVSPVGYDEESLIAFQAVADQIIEHAGDGFYLYPLPHRSSDYGRDYYDGISIVQE